MNARQSHALRAMSVNWGYAICACGAVGHEELVGNVRAWHARHKRSTVAVPPTPSGHKPAKAHAVGVPGSHGHEQDARQAGGVGG